MKLNLHNTIIKEVKTSPDGGVRLKLEMQQLPPEEMAQLFSVVNTEMVEIDTDAESESKSPTKRLLDRMLAYYMKTHNDSAVGFDTWRVQQLDQIGQKYLDKIS